MDCKRFTLLLNASLALGFIAASAGAAAASLPQTVEQAVLRNPEVQARYRNFAATAAEQDAARGGLLPRLDLQGGYGRERTESPTGSSSFNHPALTLELRQLLFDGFATASDAKRLGFTKLARYYELLATTDEIALEAVRAYLDVQRYQILMQLAADNWNLHKEIFDQLESRTKAGVGRRVDLEQAGGRLALARSNWLTESGNLHDVSARFERIVGVAPSELADTGSFESKLPKETEVLAAAVRDNPSFLAAVASIQASQHEVQARRGAYSPTVELRASHGAERNQLGVPGSYRDSRVQLVLNYNLFSGGTDNARVRQAQEQQYAATELRDKACRDLRQTAAIAYNDMRRLGEQAQYLEQHRLATMKARDAYRQQFDIGQRSLLDVLDTENELFEAKRAHVRAQFDSKLAQFRVLSATHRILPVLELKSVAEEAPAEAERIIGAQEAAIRCNTSLPPMPAFPEQASVAVPAGTATQK